MSKLDELREGLAYVADELRAIHDTYGDDDLDADTEARFNEGIAYVAEQKAAIAKLEARDAAIADLADVVRTAPASVATGDGARGGAPAVHLRVDDVYDPDYIRSVGVAEATKRAIGETPHISDEAREVVTSRVRAERSDPEHMRWFSDYYLRHSSDAYARGFFKLMSGAAWDVTPEEAHALRSARQWDQERGLTLTAANGGAMIPTHLDPSVVLTNAGVVSPLRQISRVVPVMTNVWNGVSSAGVTFAWSTEGGDSSDIAATYASPSVTCYKYHGTVPVTIEAFGDIQGLGDEVAREIADGKERLLGAAFATGSGSGQPIGIVTALQGLTGTGRQSVHATNSAFLATDVIATQNALGSRYQPNASWISSLTYQNKVRAFGDTAFYGRSVTFPEGVSDAILGKPWYEVSDMTGTLSTASNYTHVYGDFSNYLIAERVGTEVEFIPQLFSSGNNLPNGKRGWYAYGRVGADSINDSGFVLSVNPAV